MDVLTLIGLLVKLLIGLAPALSAFAAGAGSGTAEADQAALALGSARNAIDDATRRAGGDAAVDQLRQQWARRD